jgi:hypothetical protein
VHLEALSAVMGTPEARAPQSRWGRACLNDKGRLTPTLRASQQSATEFRVAAGTTEGGRGAVQRIPACLYLVALGPSATVRATPIMSVLV